MRSVSFSGPSLDAREAEAVAEVVRSGWIRAGPRVAEFEKQIAGLTCTRNAVAVSSCTAALHLCLLAQDIEGKDVLVPSFTFAATVNAIVHANGRPVFVDVLPDTFTIDPDDIRKKITKNSSVIIPVHLFGHPCDMDEILEIAEENELKVIEDCAHALGSQYRGKSPGSFGLAGCFSFDTLKNVTTAEGGMLVTNDDKLAYMTKLLRNHGMDENHKHVLIGLNYKMTDIQAAIGLVQLGKLDENLHKRRLLRECYDKVLTDPSLVEVPKEDANCVSNFTFYTVKLRRASATKMQKTLIQDGIETKSYRPVHLEPVYRNWVIKDSLAVTERISKRALSLPMHPGLSEGDILGVARHLEGRLRAK